MTGSWVSGWLLLLLCVMVMIFWPGNGLYARWSQRRVMSQRRLFEDALKHLVAWEHRRMNATPESLAGALDLSQRRVLALLTRMEARGLVRSASEGLRLTPAGESWALHVVRAHRLWERYLADDAGVPMSKLHQAAEKAEHTLTPEKLDALEAHLGHPVRDPHGDPIPTAEGAVDPLRALSLGEWPVGESALIVHIEDEPDVIFQQILAAGFLPGKTIRILERTPERLLLSDGEHEHRMAHVVAANIQVTQAPGSARPQGAGRLSELAVGQAAEVMELDPACRGFTRRRLLDLGLTPGTRVEAALENTFGDPRAFRVRGTLIALRRAQASQIWVRPLSASNGKTEPAEAVRT